MLGPEIKAFITSFLAFLYLGYYRNMLLWAPFSGKPPAAFCISSFDFFQFCLLCCLHYLALYVTFSCSILAFTWQN